MPGNYIPPEVEAVFHGFYTCEFSTIGKDGAPSTWPVLPVYLSARNQFVILTPIGLSNKTNNIRRNQRVALLFSEPTGSGLVDPPAVLVQGTAMVRDEILTTEAQYGEELSQALREQAQKVVQDQPAVGIYMKNFLTRYLMDWYFMRLQITITPHQIQWWEHGDFTREPVRWEAMHVG